MAQVAQTPISRITPKTHEVQPQKASKQSIVALDGVRAIAALLVMTLHINEIAGIPWNVNQNPFATTFAVFGRNGVVLFFVLSGFLLFLPYARALLFEERLPSTRTFYLRRIFRIWPGYYVTLALMILLFERQYLQPAYWKRLALFLTFFMDSSPKTWQQLNGPFWTLAIEWQFYLLLPLLALCFFRIVKAHCSSAPEQRLKVIVGCCVGLIIWGLLIRGFGVYYQRHPLAHGTLLRPVATLFLFFLFGIQGKYLEVFALGMIVSALYIFAQHPLYGKAVKARLERLSDPIWKLGWVVLIFLALWHAEATQARNGTANFTALSLFHPLRSYFAWLGEPIVGVGFSLCILAILFGSPALRWLFELPFLRWIGLFSYGIYMWHQRLIIYFCGQILPHIPHMGGTLHKDVATWLFVALFILPFCYLFYRLIEAPGIRLGGWIIARKLKPR